MADKFKVGDVCIVIDIKSLHYGQEVQITSERKDRCCIRQGIKIFTYLTDLDSIYFKGLKCIFEEHQLKLKTFDGEQKVFDMFESLNVTKEKVEELV